MITNYLDHDTSRQEWLDNTETNAATLQNLEIKPASIPPPVRPSIPPPVRLPPRAQIPDYNRQKGMTEWRPRPQAQPPGQEAPDSAKTQAYHNHPKGLPATAKDITGSRQYPPDKSGDLLAGMEQPHGTAGRQGGQGRTDEPATGRGAEGTAPPRQRPTSTSRTPLSDQRQETDDQSDAGRGVPERRHVQPLGTEYSTPGAQSHGKTVPRKSGTAELPKNGRTSPRTAAGTTKEPIGTATPASAEAPKAPTTKPTTTICPERCVRPWHQETEGGETPNDRKEEPELDPLRFPFQESMMEQIATEDNVERAIQQVRKKCGRATGIDGQTLKETIMDIEFSIEELIAELRDGRYQPQPGRRIEVPKPRGGKRMILIPTFRDRIVARAVQNVVEPLVEGHFHPSSHGFRPGRGVFTAADEAKAAYVEDPYGWVAEMDFKNCFGSIDHRKMIETLKTITSDQILLALIEKFMKAGHREGNETISATVGLAPGNPMSPLLLNIYLHELDRYMGSKGRFSRYADDIVLYAQSRRGANRRMRKAAIYAKRLSLILNEGKSRVRPAEELEFVGLTFTGGKTGMAQATIWGAQHKVTGPLETNDPATLDYQLLKTQPRLRGMAAHYRRIDRKEGLIETLERVKEFVGTKKTRMMGLAQNDWIAEAKIDEIIQAAELLIIQLKVGG